MSRAGGNKRRAKDDDLDDDSPLFEAEVTPKKSRVHESEDEDEGDNDNDDDGSDGGESESDDGDLYYESVEPYPAHAAYDDEIEDVKSALTSLAKEAQDMFAKLHCNTQDVRELRDKVKEVSAVPDYKRITIGLLGDAGEGKSSLVSSLADCPGLAKALDAGKSCTFVITEYTKAVPKQRKDFSATIECFDLQTVGVILSSALDDWTLFHGGKDQGWSQDDRQYYENKASTCLSIFRAIFSTHDMFLTDVIATETLHRISNMELTREQEIAVCVDNAKAALDATKGLQQRDGKYTGYFESDSTEKLWAGLDRYITETPPDGEPSHWPLVKKVTIGVAQSRLLDKVTLVDMPGISDTNQVRVDTTIQHVNNCDHLFIVARAGRIVTSTTVNTLLQKYAKAFRGNVAVIATKCDDGIDHACAMEMERNGYDIGNYHALRVSSDLMVARIKDLKLQRRKYRKGKGQHGKLTNDISAVEESRQKIENSRWELISKARNQHIIRNLLLERGRHMPPKKKLKVFCVSNKHYDIHKGSDETCKFVLSPNGTGIPSLRQQTLLLAAPRMLGAIDDYTDHRFKVFLRGYELWSSVKAVLAKERDALRTIVLEPRKSLPGELQEYHRKVQEQVEKQLIVPMQEGQDKFVEHAVNMLQHKIAALHHGTIAAFARRNGNFKKSLVCESWNTLFTETSTANLEESWEFFIPRQESLAEEMEENVVGAVRDLIGKLKAQPAAVSLPMKTFEEAMEGRIVAIRQHFKSRLETSQRELRQTYIDATIDSEDNIFAAAMHEAYDLCKNDSGTGVKARSIGYLHAHLMLSGDRSPFAAMATSIGEEIDTASTTQTDGLVEDINAVFDLAAKDFQTMTRKKSNDPSELPVRDAIKGYLKTAGPAFDAVCKQMEEIKTRYPADV